MHPRGPPAPPPPPPLLPPPPPPPPPFHNGQGGFAKGNHRRSRMRNFNWETLPKHSVIGKLNIWTADNSGGKYELDTDHMEELFSHNQGLQHPRALNRHSVRGLPSPGVGAEMVSVLSAKRSMNIGIFLKQFKKPVKDMIENIKRGSGLSFGSGKLWELCRMLPDDGEMKELLKFKGDLSALPEADLFMLMLVKVPSYEERLSCLVLKEEFAPLMKELKEYLGTLTDAGNELLECESLHSVIRLVLKTGNYMNAGGYAGSAIGFRMASLLKLADTKANKPGMNLMHYVVMQAQKADEALMKFPEQLKHVESASRINKSDIEAEFEKLVRKVQKAKTDSEKEEDLKIQMREFLKDADISLEEMEMGLQQLQAISDEVAEYFCEDPDKFKLDECCGIFNSFCGKFIRAMQENKAREIMELKQKNRDRLQNTAKRRSTATCSSRDKEMDKIALEFVLKNVLTNRTHRRKLDRSFPADESLNNETKSINSSQSNVLTGHLPQSKTVGHKDVCRAEWSPAGELSETIPKRNESSDPRSPNEGKLKTSTNKWSENSTQQTMSSCSITSSNASFSLRIHDDKSVLQDNSEEEAQKLREVSKKVLRYQRSRGCVSSEDCSLENRRPPVKKAPLRRHLTFDEETQRYPGDPTNEDLVRFLLSDDFSSKLNFRRRNTFPDNTFKTSKEEVNQFNKTSDKCTKHGGQDRGTQLGESIAQSPTKPKSDLGDFPLTPKKRSVEYQQLSLSEEKTKTYNSSFDGIDGKLLHQNNESKTTKNIDTPLLVANENVPHKHVWLKTETSGLFFTLFKRLGDLSKAQNNRETVHSGMDSSV